MLVDLGGGGHGDDAMDRSSTDYTRPIYYIFFFKRTSAHYLFSLSLSLTHAQQSTFAFSTINPVFIAFRVNSHIIEFLIKNIVCVTTLAIL